MKATLIVAFALLAPVAAVTAPGLMRREPEVIDGAMIEKVQGGSCSAQSDSNCCFTKAAIEDIKKTNPRIKVVPGQCAAGTKDIAGGERYATLWKKLQTCKTDACQATNVPAGPDGTCKAYVCPKGFSTKKGVAKAPCNSATTCNFNCCNVEINADPVRKMGILTYAALWAVSNVTRFSNQIGFPIMHEASDYKNDLKVLNDAVLGLTKVMNDIGNNKSCPPQKSADDFSHLNHIKACVDAALCEMAANERTKEEVKTITMLREYYGKFETITWDYLWASLDFVSEENEDTKDTTDKQTSAFASTKVDFVEAAELECIGISGFMKSMGSKALLDTDKEAAYATSKALYEAARFTHAVVNAHTDNSSLDATIAALHRAWEPACKLLNCDHTNYWDMLGASHLHSIALIEAGASSHHMQVHVRTRARLDLQMQRFLGAQGRGVANKFYRVEGTSTEARHRKYGHFLCDGLKNQMKNYPKTYGIDALTGLYNRAEMKKSFKTPVQALLLAGYWDDRLFIVENEQDLAEVEEIRALVSEKDLDEEDEQHLEQLIHRTMFWKAIGNFFQDVGKAVVSVAETVADGLVAVAEAIGSVTVSIGKGIAKAATAVGNGLEDMAQTIGKGIVQGLTALGEAVITIVEGIANAIEAFIDFIISLFACMEFGSCSKIGYGAKFPEGEDKTIGVCLTIAMVTGFDLMKILKNEGLEVSGFGIDISFVAGFVPGGAIVGGVRIGVGIGLGIICPTGGGCLIEIAVGVVCSAIIPKFGAGSPRCVLGPVIKLGVKDFACAESFGIVFKIICCYLNIIDGCHSCGKGGCQSSEKSPEQKKSSKQSISDAEIEDGVAAENGVCAEYMSGQGEDYRGCQSHTKSGRECQKWSSQYPHKHDVSGGYAGTGDHNMCRNPLGKGNIWCYTKDPKEEWEYCDKFDSFVFAPHGSLIAIHNTKAKRFWWMSGGQLRGMTRNYDQFVDGWRQAKWRVIMAGENTVALWNPSHKFIRMQRNSMKCSPSNGAYNLPSAWKHERFEVEFAGKDEVAFKQPHWNAWVSMSNTYLKPRTNYAGHTLSDSERMRVLMLDEAARVEPGSEVGLHCTIHGKFLRMNANMDMDQSHPYNINDFPRSWEWERFMVVLGKPQWVANHGIDTPDWGFHSKAHKRFIKMAGANMMASPEKSLQMVPQDWYSERFRVVNAGKKHVAIHNNEHGRFIRMHHNGVDTSNPVGVNGLPASWGWERFKVLHTASIKFPNQKEKIVPGATISLLHHYGDRWCQDRGSGIHCSALTVGAWEKFYVDRAPAGDQFGLRGGKNHRWCTDSGYRGPHYWHGGVSCTANKIGIYEAFLPTVDGSNNSPVRWKCPKTHGWLFGTAFRGENPLSCNTSPTSIRSISSLFDIHSGPGAPPSIWATTTTTTPYDPRRRRRRRRRRRGLGGRRRRRWR